MIMIPKIFHQIWLGLDPLPKEFEEYGKTWAKHHPGWTMKLWTEENLPKDLELADYISKSKSYSNQSNLIRYELLFRYGGVYVDTDFECFKSIEPLLDDLTVFSGYQIENPDGVGAVNPALIGSVSGHPFIRSVIDAVPRWFGPNVLPCVLGPQLFTVEAKKSKVIKIFPKEMFYPYRWDEPHRRHEKFPDAYAVHYWSSNWIPGMREKIFGIGLSRTGTLSLAHALKSIGFNAIHFPHTYDRLDEDVDAAVDGIVPCDFEELDKKFPHSKFILTTRGIGEWLGSMEWLMDRGFYLPREGGKPPEMTPIIRRIFERLYGTTSFNESLLADGYRRHHKRVTDYFSSRRGDLLEMSIVDGDGWGKLCTFLRRPIPKAAFPHLHARGVAPQS